jgi:hypothetical protein
MNWEKIFEWQMKRLSTKPSRVKEPKKNESSVLSISPTYVTDLEDLKLSYNQHGQLHLSDVRPTGIILRTEV